MHIGIRECLGFFFAVYLDDVVAELGLHGFADGTNFLSEGSGLELRHHLPFLEFTEVSAFGFAGAIGMDSGHLAEVFSFFGNELFAKLFGCLFLGGELSRLGDALG